MWWWTPSRACSQRVAQSGGKQVVGMAQKWRDFRENELQTLIWRITMDKDELPSNIHHEVRKDTHPSTRTIHAVFAEKSVIGGKLRKISGQHGITFQHCFRGDPEALRINHKKSGGRMDGRTNIDNESGK